MSAPQPGSSKSVLSWVGLGLAGLCVLWAFVAHHGFGPDLAGEDGDWWKPRGFLAGAAASVPLDGGPGAIVVGALPALLLTLGVFFTTRSAIARFLAVSSTIAAASFGFYGIWFDAPWNFFKSHWSGTVVVFSLAVGGSLCAVLLTRSFRKLPVWARIATYLPIVALVVFLERNITGTNPELAFAISPWPAAQVFGLETLATCIALVLVGVGAGLWLFSRLLERLGRYVALAAGGVVGVALPPLAIALGSSLDLLPFQAGAGILRLVLLATAVTLVAAGASLVGQPAGLSQRARLFLSAGLLLALPLLGGQALSRADYATTRDTRARQIIDALAAHFAETEQYPNQLAELVEAGRLDAIPKPRIGFAAFPTQDGFVYQNFGTSYLLEFSSPRWIQCAYNPPYPYLDELDEEELAEMEEGELAGAWSCPSKPPELW